MTLKGHGNEADFLGFLQKSVPQLSDSPSRGVDKIAYRYNFIKPLTKSLVIVHNIRGLFFAKLVLSRAGLAVESSENR